ncbi:DMT family transporter [Piscinibacter sakaiensis]|uniref:DMT family transporter n=1 Tax=Piscinibacter sakaiensis TaxID=1547922 RepID=UPI003AB00A84
MAIPPEIAPGAELPATGLRGHWLRVGGRFEQLDPTVRGLIWSTAAGMIFVVLNATMRALAQQLDPFQTQFLRYLAGLVVLLPLLFRGGLTSWWPRHIGGQFGRGALHALGLTLWFIALPQIPLADMTALGFTTPIFIMIGAMLFFREPMRWERWAAVGFGFVGVLIVVAPKMTGDGGIYNLVMLSSAPLFAASFLVTKALTRYERTGVILLWQGITVSLFSLPLALLHWQQPSAAQWLGFAVCGLLGNSAHYCLTQSYRIADISSTQSVKFLDLVWATLIGWLAFGDSPSQATLIGGSVICAATLWVARRERRSRIKPETLV